MATGPAGSLALQRNPCDLRSTTRAGDGTAKRSKPDVPKGPSLHAADEARFLRSAVHMAGVQNTCA
eukprot:15478399-Alexandrium_andersonii.AAC.1